MKTLPKNALFAATLATVLVGISTTAIVQASVLQSSTLSAGEAPVITVVAQADNAPNRPAVKPAAPTAEQRTQMRAERMERMQKKMAERQAQLKTELKLTPAQEPAWNAFVARTQPQARPAPQAPRADWSKLTTPERLDKMQALKTERDARIAQRTEAVKSFYAALDTSQKKVFDDKYRLGATRAGMHHKGHRGDHSHHRDHVKS